MMTTYFWQSYSAFLTFFAKNNLFLCHTWYPKNLTRHHGSTSQNTKTHCSSYIFLFYSSYNHTHSCLETKLCFSVKHQTIFSQMSWHFTENIEKWCWPNPMDWPIYTQYFAGKLCYVSQMCMANFRYAI